MDFGARVRQIRRLRGPALLRHPWVTHTITLGNTGAVDSNAAITDVLSAYYTVYDKMDFVEAPNGTLTWAAASLPRRIM